jgi:hypothetical protein
MDIIAAALKAAAEGKLRTEIFALQVDARAEKRFAQERRYHFVGSQRSFRGTYDEDPNESCLHERINFDPEARAFGCCEFAANSAGEEGVFASVSKNRGVMYEEAKSRVPVRRGRNASIPRLSKQAKEVFVPDPEGDVTRVIPGQRGRGAITIRGRMEPVPQILGDPSYQFETEEGPIGAPYLLYGKGRAPGTNTPSGRPDTTHPAECKCVDCVSARKNVDAFFDAKRQGVAVDAVDGWPRTSRQKHDDREHDATTYLRDFNDR